METGLNSPTHADSAARTKRRRPLRPNLFQRAMLHWDETLPYNASHAIFLNLPYDADRLHTACSKALAACGFPADEDEIEIKPLPQGFEVQERLRAAFEAELNQRFERDGETLPFRFFWTAAPDGGFVLGLSYFHPIAAGDSISWLLQDIAARFADPNSEGVVQWTASEGLSSPRYRTILLSQWRHFLPWFVSMPGFYKKIRTYLRLSGQHRKGAISRVRAMNLSPDQRQWIRKKMASTGATFNDILAGLILYGLAKAMPERVNHRKRRNLAIGSIINIRNHFGPEQERTFGLFLALFSVSYSLDQLDQLDELFRQIRSQTAQIKKDRLYLRNLFLLGFGAFFRRFLNEDRQVHMSHRGFPLAAGLSNFYVDHYWSATDSLPVEDYWRAVSASPSTPLVVSVTTFRDKTNLIYSWNESFFSEQEIDSLASYLSSLMEGAA